MSRTDDILDKTKRKEPEAKKWKVVVGIVVGLVLACGFFGFIFWFADVDEYLNTKQVIHLYEFYEEKSNIDDNSVYFLGSSIVGYSVYPPEINKILHDRGYNISAYNLFLNSESPLEMSLQTQNIINAHPELVIIGVIPRNFEYDSWQEERIVLVKDMLEYDESYLDLLSEDELSHLEIKPDFIYKKKYISSAIKYRYFPMNPNGDINEIFYSNDYYTDPIGRDYRILKSNQKQNSSEISEAAVNSHDWHPVFSTDLNQQKVALLYMVDELSDAQIPVILVSMPQHSQHVELISSESRANYHHYLNMTGVHWIDLESLFDDSMFMDHCHFTYDGALAFAPVVADIIIQEMS